MLDPSVAQVLAALPSPPPGAAPPTLDEQRRGYEQVRSLQGPARAVGEVHDLVAVHGGLRVPVRLYRPARNARRDDRQQSDPQEGDPQQDGRDGAPVDVEVLPLLVFAHGGAWILGSLDVVDVPARELADRARVVVLTVAYRLAPEHPYPAALDDVLTATRWAVDHADELGIDPARVAVGGESAGGNLAAAAALRARDEHGPALAAQLLIYPNTDADFDRPSMLAYDGIAITRDLLRTGWNAYRPHPADPGGQYAAPLHASDLTGLPPATVITGEHDMLRDEGEAYAHRLAAAGVLTTLVRLPGMPHGALSFLGAAPATHQVLDVAATALRRLHDDPPPPHPHGTTDPGTGPHPGPPPTMQEPDMRFHATGTITAPHQLARHAQEETDVLRQLLDEGVVERFYLRTDRAGAYFVVRGEDLTAARQHMHRLPFVAHDLMALDYAEIDPT